MSDFCCHSHTHETESLWAAVRLFGIHGLSTVWKSCRREDETHERGWKTWNTSNNEQIKEVAEIHRRWCEENEEIEMYKWHWCQDLHLQAAMKHFTSSHSHLMCTVRIQVCLQYLHYSICSTLSALFMNRRQGSSQFYSLWHKSAACPVATQCRHRVRNTAEFNPKWNVLEKKVYGF